MAAWDNIAFDYPAEVPTMLSPEELRYLYWLGRDVWTDSGAIVEIGPWLGGSTVSLLIGARDRVRPANHKLHAFDNFIWHDFMSDRAPISLADGSNFQRYFEANVSNFHESLVIHRQSLQIGRAHV